MSSCWPEKWLFDVVNAVSIVTGLSFLFKIYIRIAFATNVFYTDAVLACLDCGRPSTLEPLGPTGQIRRDSLHLSLLLICPLFLLFLMFALRMVLFLTFPYCETHWACSRHQESRLWSLIFESFSKASHGLIDFLTSCRFHTFT